MGDGGVELVRAHGADALVFEIDVRGGVEDFLKAAGTHEGSGTPDFVEIPHRLGDFDPRVGGVHLLPRGFLAEERTL